MTDDRRHHPRRTVLNKAERDRAAEVFTTHQRFVEAVARQHAPGPDHVPDIVQAVGVQVCRGLNGFRGNAEITTWLYRVTVNTARDYYRRESRQYRRPCERMQTTPMPDQIVDPDDQLIHGEKLQALADAIDRLRPSDRRLIKKQLSESGVLSGSRLSRHRARQALRQQLADDPRLEPDE